MPNPSPSPEPRPDLGEWLMSGGIVTYSVVTVIVLAILWWWNRPLSGGKS